MRFNPKARLDPSQMDDQTGGGGGFPGGGGLRVGGVLGLILLILGAIFGIDTSAITGGNPTQPDNSQAQPQDPGEFTNECQTGEDANTSEKCQLLGITNSVNAFWATQYPKETGDQYPPAQVVPFSGVVATQGCGQATSDVGPFYCPNDQKVYLDMTFFRDMLEGRLGGRDAGFTRAYVVAHEIGHHIENGLGILGQIRTQQGANSDAVKVELMADCLAGAWAKHATQVPDETGQPFLAEVTQQDIEDAIGAAQTVGDDRIQQRTSGRVAPEMWTHGSAEQRMKAFSHGMKNGTIASCNLFG